LRKHNDWWTRNKGLDEALRDPTDERPNATSLSRLWTQTKANRLEEDGTDWTAELMRNTVTYALKAVDDGFKHYFRRRKNKEAKRCRICIKFKRRWPCEHCYGYPRFKSADDREAFTIQDQSFRAEPRAIKLGKIGMVRTCQYVLPMPTVRATRAVQPQSHWLHGRVLRISVSRHADRWYASIMVERDRKDPSPCEAPKPVVGVDLGISMAATVSDGRSFAPDDHLERKLKRLAKLSRQQARKQHGSANYTAHAMKVAVLHKHVADARGHHLHQISHELATTCSVVVTEGYDVRALAERRGPTRGQHRASETRRKMMSTGLGELRRQLEYKGRWYGARFEKVASDFPSDQTCNLCGHVNEHMRECTSSAFDCKRCGYTSSRQANTADLLARLGRGEPFPDPAITLDVSPSKSSKGRKPRRSRAGHARSDAPGGQGRSHGPRVRDEASPANGEARTTEEPLGLTDADGGTP